MPVLSGVEGPCSSDHGTCPESDRRIPILDELQARADREAAAVERISRITDAKALQTVGERLKSRETGEFAYVHWCPADSGEVSDESQARLVVIPPQRAHSKEESKALEFAREVLERRGTAPSRSRPIPE